MISFDTLVYRRITGYVYNTYTMCIHPNDVEYMVPTLQYLLPLYIYPFGYYHHRFLFLIWFLHLRVDVFCCFFFKFYILAAACTRWNARASESSIITIQPWWEQMSNQLSRRQSTQKEIKIRFKIKGKKLIKQLLLTMAKQNKIHSNKHRQQCVKYTIECSSYVCLG